MTSERYDEAEREVSAAESLMDEASNIRVYGHTLRVGAELAIARGDWDKAKERCEKNMQTAMESGNRSLRAISLAARANLKLEQIQQGLVSSTEGVDEDLHEAMGLFQEMGDAVELARTYKLSIRSCQLSGATHQIPLLEEQLELLNSPKE